MFEGNTREFAITSLDSFYLSELESLGIEIDDSVRGYFTNIILGQTDVHTISAFKMRDLYTHAIMGDANTS